MIKLKLFILLPIILHILSCAISNSNSGDINSNDPGTIDKKITGSWTILIHFAVDNNIDYEFEKNEGIITNYLSTLENIKKNDVNDKLKIIVLMDSFNGAKSFKDGYYHLTGGEFNNDIIVPKTEINSGSVTEVEAFMQWAVTNYPSNNYFYSIFDHGSGFDDTNIDGKLYSSSAPLKSIGIDERLKDSLSHNELGQITAYMKKLINKNIDIFFAYACVMGGVELAYELKNNVNYLLSSEDFFPADYWSYEALNVIINNESLSARDIGKAFCDSAYDFFNNKARFTLSFIDLSKMNQLYDSIDLYAGSVISDINSAETARKYDDIAGTSYYYYYYVDLGDYLDKIIASAKVDQEIKNKARIVKSDLSNCVLYSRNVYAPYSSGLTIYHNIWTFNVQYPVSTYKQILSFGSNKWADYMAIMGSYIPKFEKDLFEDDNDSEHAKEITVNDQTQFHTLDNSNDNDWMYFSGISDYNYTITCDASEDILDMWLIIEETTNSTTSVRFIQGTISHPIKYSCDTTKKYYLYVEPYGGRTGNYEIKIRGLSKPLQDTYEKDENVSTAKAIDVNGQSQNRTLDSDNDSDYIYFDGVAGSDYIINIDADDDILNAYLYDENTLINNPGLTMGDKNIGWGCVGSPIGFSCTESKKYYIVVTSYYSGIGNYQVGVKTGISLQSNSSSRSIEKIKLLHYNP